MVLQDIIEPLTESLSRFSYKANCTTPSLTSTRDPSPEIAAILGQIDEVRRQISEIEPVNFADIIAWIISLAKKQKLWLKR